MAAPKAGSRWKYGGESEFESVLTLFSGIGRLRASYFAWPTMASVWTSLNLSVAILAVIASISVALWWPKWKWTVAVISSLVIAIPPYPYWAWNSERRGWYLHFFHGFTLQNLPLASFGLVFLAALALFAVVYWGLSLEK
jgi:hypothetical protein